MGKYIQDRKKKHPLDKATDTEKILKILLDKAKKQIERNKK